MGEGEGRGAGQRREPVFEGRRPPAEVLTKVELIDLANLEAFEQATGSITPATEYP